MPFDPATFARISGRDTRTEARALVAVMAAHFGDLDHPELAQTLATPLSADMLGELARLNKLGVFLAVQRDSLRAIAPDLPAWLDQIRLRTLTMNHRNLLLGVEVSVQLAAAAIEHVHFKGPLQQLRLYGSPYMKPAGDIDILVHRRDLAAAAAVLKGMGFAAGQDHAAGWSARFLGEQHFTRAPGDPVVDLHHRLQQPGSPAPRDLAAVIARAEPQMFGGHALPVLSASDRCLISAISVVKALFGREPCGGYVMDMRAALEALSPADAAALPGLAAAHGLAETLAFAARAVRMLFGERGAARLIGGDPLAHVPDADLFAMILTPWDQHLVWPRRRAVLWAMCGRRPLRYAGETLRALLSEAYLRAG